MSISSTRSVQIEFSGDTTLQVIQSALQNDTSSGEVNLFTLAAGDNSIDPPVVSGITVVGVMIIPPAGNTILMVLKGDPGDVGIPLHLTDPTSLALDSTFIGLIINAASEIVGVRFVWS